MFGLIKKIFIKLLTGLVNESNHIKCVLLNNQKCITQPTLIKLHPNEYTENIRHYPFVVKLHKCVESCITLNDLSNKAFVPNKTEFLNISVFSIISGINESKITNKSRSNLGQSIYYTNVNKELMEENTTQRNGRILININVSITNTIYI